MTTVQKKKVQRLAAEFEPFGVTFIDVLRLFSSAQNEMEKTFDESYALVHLFLCHQSGHKDTFAIDEIAALTGQTPEQVEAEAMERGIKITKVDTEKTMPLLQKLWEKVKE